jgi:hypothetical protein
MRRTVRVETKTETRVLACGALLCYSTTLAAMWAGGYALLALALRACGRELAAVLYSAGM